ncbi:uncharacterized protein LOC129916021 [Episyrphus balteatus]|uniref:uncharacterized protein LOC129916021 n=1 Tax=Episyrphus balteatus TaxID=286459 RepID=UPI002486BDD6|nr:uncharacterized protein LOC129916021 [Episyrphus balteatus]
MATETTRLLLTSEYVVDISNGADCYESLDESHKLKSLSLEELLPFQDDPWWQNVRRTFFFSFWITVIITFSSACILSVLQHGSCAAMKHELPKTTTMMVPVITTSTLSTSS